MQFQVPQFIEVEDKIFGPFTIKQFIYLAGAGGVVFILYSLLPLLLALIFSAPVVALGVALAFYKVNNRPFIDVVESAFRYSLGNRLYIWKKEPKKIIKKEKEEKENDADMYIPKLSDSKLKDLSWSLDIQESMHSNKNQRGKQNTQFEI